MGIISHYQSHLTIAALACLLCGCLPKGQPLVAERSPVFDPPPVASVDQPAGFYTVRKGDTLYSIAWRFELDFRGLAYTNGLQVPYTIYPGQRVKLDDRLANKAATAVEGQPKGSRQTSTTAQQSKQKQTTQRSTGRPSAATKPSATPAQQAPAQARWRWPMPAPPQKEFGARSKGMDFAYRGAAVVRAANHGQVVYAGPGLGGHSRLIIIKHSPTLLSAYGFNGATKVEEGQSVKAGASLADIIYNGRGNATVHFELRRNGQPINPRKLLQ